jgi:hypothetical protein
LGGIPCFRGTRVPFQNLLDYLEAGDTLDEFLEPFPTVYPSNGHRGPGDRKGLALHEDRVRILLDECLPKDLWKRLIGHECQTVPPAGLAGKANGELLVLAERSGWQALLAMDRGMLTSKTSPAEPLSLAIIRAKSTV